MLEDTEGPKLGGGHGGMDEAQKLFKDLDKDGDGSITIEEFVEGYIRCGAHFFKGFYVPRLTSKLPTVM
jgi:hypothetical protein